MIIENLCDQLIDRLQTIKIDPMSILIIGEHSMLREKVLTCYPNAKVYVIHVDAIENQKQRHDLILSVGGIGFSKFPPKLLFQLLSLLINDKGLLLFCVFLNGTVDIDQTPLWPCLQSSDQWIDALVSPWAHPVLDVFSIKVQKLDWIKELMACYPVDKTKKMSSIQLETLFGIGWKEAEGTEINIDRITRSY